MKYDTSAMNTIYDLIAQKPHLEEPLRFYEKTLQFEQEIGSLVITPRLDLHAYPLEQSGLIIEHFSSIFGLAEGLLQPLKHALELGEIDFLRLPLLEVPAFSLPYPEDDLTMLLFLMSRPYFLALRKRQNTDTEAWEEGKCPVCSARPSLSSMTREGERRIFCSFCGTEGKVQTMGCLYCGTEDGAARKMLTFEGEEGVKLDACDSCRSYGKVIDEWLLARMTIDLADVVSLPLDIVVQQKGYKRRSPNPIGMVRLSASG